MSGEVITFGGRILPALTPVGLRDVFVSPKGPLTNLQALRDADPIASMPCSNKTATASSAVTWTAWPSRSPSCATYPDNLLGSLATIKTNDLDGQLTAAVALIQMNVTPASVIFIPFGGDNHSDANLARESAQHVSSCAAIASLWQKLAAAKLDQKTTFVLMNVFGRTLNRPQRMGRDHLGSHHCTVISGKRDARFSRRRRHEVRQRLCRDAD